MPGTRSIWCDDMLTINFVLILLAFALTLISGITNRVPLWVPVMLITIVMLLR